MSDRTYSRLDFRDLTSLARTILENGEDDHHQDSDKHDNDRDLERNEKEADQHDELFEQCHHDEYQGDDGSESAKTFKNATTTHNLTPYDQ